MRTTPRTSSEGTTGTTWPSTPSTAWWWAVVPGKRTAEKVQELVGGRQGAVGRPDAGADHHRRIPAPTEEAILEAFGDGGGAAADRQAGAAAEPYKVAPEGLNYATVHKTREKGRVVKVATRVIFGTVGGGAGGVGRFEW